MVRVEHEVLPYSHDVVRTSGVPGRHRRAIAQIYNEGIEDRVGTFETRPRSPDDVRAWFDGVHPIVVVEDEGRRVIAFASTSTYRTRECYAGIAEFSVYVARAARGQGAGRVAMEALIAAAAKAGFWKLLSRIFVENTASRTLMARVGLSRGRHLREARQARRGMARRGHRGTRHYPRTCADETDGSTTHLARRHRRRRGPVHRAPCWALDRDETMRQTRELGLALPLVLLPSVGWHLLRAAGWWVCFPPESRPSFWRVFRVRLAADGVGYFTIRGVASEPLRVVLLMGRVPPVVSAAASVLERTAMGIMSVVGVGVFAAFAVSSDMLPPRLAERVPRHRAHRAGGAGALVAVPDAHAAATSAR